MTSMGSCCGTCNGNHVAKAVNYNNSKSDKASSVRSDRSPAPRPSFRPPPQQFRPQFRPQNQQQSFRSESNQLRQLFKSSSSTSNFTSPPVPAAGARSMPSLPMVEVGQAREFGDSSVTFANNNGNPIMGDPPAVMDSGSTIPVMVPRAADQAVSDASANLIPSDVPVAEVTIPLAEQSDAKPVVVADKATVGKSGDRGDAMPTSQDVSSQGAFTAKNLSLVGKENLKLSNQQLTANHGSKSNTANLLSAIKESPQQAAQLTVAAAKEVPQQAAQVTAAVVKEVPKQAAQVTVAVVKEVPQQVVQVTAAVVKEMPQQAAQVTAAVVKEVPQKAASIIATAVKEVPQQAAQITQAVIQEVPQQAPAIATAAIKAAPDQAASIIQTVVQATPKQASGVIQALATQSPDVLSSAITQLSTPPGAKPSAETVSLIQSTVSQMQSPSPSISQPATALATAFTSLATVSPQAALSFANHAQQAQSNPGIARATIQLASAIPGMASANPQMISQLPTLLALVAKFDSAPLFQTITNGIQLLEGTLQPKELSSLVSKLTTFFKGALDQKVDMAKLSDLLANIQRGSIRADSIDMEFLTAFFGPLLNEEEIEKKIAEESNKQHARENILNILNDINENLATLFAYREKQKQGPQQGDEYFKTTTRESVLSY